jgi:hypothetical protein
MPFWSIPICRDLETWGTNLGETPGGDLHIDEAHEEMGIAAAYYRDNVGARSENTPANVTAADSRFMT